MKIGGFLKTSLSDYPGHISSVVFTQGCNMRCPYCHNPSLIPGKAENSIRPEEIIGFLAARRDLISGVVISGGEPLIQPDIIPFTKEIRKCGFDIKIDTNGTLPATLEKLISSGNVSYLAMDVKASPDEYDAAAGVKIIIEDIKTSISAVKSSGIPYEFRTTVVPGLHTVETIRGIGSLIVNTDFYVLQNFSGSRTLSLSLHNTPPFTRDVMEKFKNAAASFSSRCIIR